MRVLVLGDLHSNLEALTTVLADAKPRGFDRVVSGGDVVGYGADPKAVMDLLRGLNPVVVMSNHDLAVVGGLPLEGFNAYANRAVELTASQLSSEELAWLKALPYTVKEEAFAVSHGTLHKPEAFHYLLTEADAADSLMILDRPVCFLGHSHMPVWVRLAEGWWSGLADPRPVDAGRLFDERGG